MGEWRLDQTRINDLLSRVQPLERPVGSVAFKPGYLQVYAGPMYSDKTAELERVLKRAEFHHATALAFKPEGGRDPSDVLRSRLLGDYPCIAVPADNPEKILEYVTGDVQIVGIDEGQHFRPEDPTLLAEIVFALRRRKRHVVVATLSNDFRGVGFPVTQALITSGAPYVKMLTAACTFSGCTELGVFSQRIIDGRPVLDGNVVQIENASVRYEPRCIGHFEPPTD